MTPPRWLIVVQRERHDLYDDLRRGFELDDRVEVILDERQADRRMASEPERDDRRRQERRHSLPAMESAFARHAGFCLVVREGDHPVVAEIPPEVRAQGEVLPTPSLDAPVDSGRKRVLVCDDDPLVQAAIAETLAGEFEVETANRAAEAIQRIIRARYGALILDLQLPGLGGLDAAPLVKRFDEELPIIVVTGHASYEAEQALRAAGVFYYLLKPFPTEELIDAVRAAVRRRAQRGR